MTNNTYNFGLYGTIVLGLYGTFVIGNNPPKYWANNVDSSNTANGKHIYYLINENDVTLNSSNLPNAACLTLINSTGTTVENMNFSDNSVGLTLAYCNETRVENINSTSNYGGIVVTSSSNVTIQNSFVEKNYDSGIYLGFCDHCTIMSNTLQDQTAKIVLSSLGLVGSPGIELSSSNNTQVISNHALGNVVGILLWLNSYDDTVTDSNITGNSVGIASGYLAPGLPNPEDMVNNDSFIRNSITNNSYGIELYNSQGNSINGNNMTNNTYSCFSIQSNFNSFFGNDISLNKYDGIDIQSSESDSILANNITANGVYGIFLGYSSGNTFSGNNITANSYGIYLYSSSRNMIFHNAFLNNKQQVSLGYRSSNTWDCGYPSGGNYWSDYQTRYPNATEIDSSGIWNTPYNISSSNIDRYPLMAPFKSFNVSWNSQTYSVDTVSNSTLSNFSFNATTKTLRFDFTGTNGTWGFCRIAIPLSLMSCTNLKDWTVTVNGTQILPPNLNVTTDANYTYIYFTYYHSTETVKITSINAVPEFQPFMLLPLFMIIALLGALILKRKRNVKK
jgi:parallel beta-helix repeat protein